MLRKGGESVERYNVKVRQSRDPIFLESLFRRRGSKLSPAVSFTRRANETRRNFEPGTSGLGGNNINYSADKIPRRNTIRRRASPGGIVRTLSIPAINICTGLCRWTRRGGGSPRWWPTPYLSSSTETHLFTIVAFFLLHAAEASHPPGHPFSVSNLPVARNKPPLPWLLPCRIFPWVSTVAFLSHCIAPCHRDDDHNDQPPSRRWRRRQQPKRQFVCFRFLPFVATRATFLVGAKVCRFIVPPISDRFLLFPFVASSR